VHSSRQNNKSKKTENIPANGYKKHGSFILGESNVATTKLNKKGEELITNSFTKRFNKEVLNLTSPGILTYTEFTQLLNNLGCTTDEDKVKDLWNYLGGEICDAIGVDETFKALCCILRIPIADSKEDSKLRREFNDFYVACINNEKGKKTVKRGVVKTVQKSGEQDSRLLVMKKSLFVPGERSARESYCNIECDV
jgi:hypothetical protein